MKLCIILWQFVYIYKISFVHSLDIASNDERYVQRLSIMYLPPIE